MAEEEPKRGRVWGLVIATIAVLPAMLFALVVAIVVAKGMGASKAALAVAVIGAQLAAVLAVWLVLYFTFLRSRAPRRGFAYLLILVLVAVATDGGLALLGKMDVDRKAAIYQANEAAAVKTALGEAAKAEVSITYHHEYAVDLHTSSPGEAGRIARAAKALIHGVADANAAFQVKSRAVDVPNLMMPKQIAADRNFVKLSAALVTWRQALANRERQTDTAIATYRATLAGTRIDGRLKRQALDHFDAVMAAFRASRAHEVDIANRLFDECELTVRDLKSTADQWKIDGEHIEFSDPHALKVFRTHVSKTMDLVREVDSLDGDRNASAGPAMKTARPLRN